MAGDHFTQQRCLQPLSFGICVDNQNSSFSGLSHLRFEKTYLDPVFCQNYSGHFSHLPFPRHLSMYDFRFEPTFLRKRNERERQRVRCVNEGYARLREHLPPEFEDKRLSKVETLRAAISYIKHLQNLLELQIPDAVMELLPIQMTECNSDGESKHSLSDSGEQCY